MITNKTKPYILSVVHFRNLLRDGYARFFAPNICVQCGRESNSAISLCSDCAEQFFGGYLKMHETETEAFCNVCGKALISEVGVCQRCKKSFIHAAIPAEKFQDKSNDANKTQLNFERNFALFPYIGDGSKIVSDWKNVGMRNYAAVFAKYILEFLRSNRELDGLCIVPVPPRPSKLKTKGWDQIADLASELRANGKTILPVLRRRDGLSQKRAGKAERAKNIDGKFYLHASGKRTIPESVILLDDIITTGATLNECSRVLTAAGCKKVYGLCLFFL